VSSIARSNASFRFRGRSFLAFALAPQQPLAEWLAALDNWLHGSAGFFTGKPVLLDLTGLNLTKAELASVITDLETRDIRIIGIEGTDASRLGPGMPPLITGGRTLGGVQVLNRPTRGKAQTQTAATSPLPQENELFLDRPVRSGQSVVFPGGDVTVIGSVGSGAEVIAGGSIHIYGTLRGRAMAGATGNSRARIFCNKIEAELLAIDGLYKTADDLEPKLRNRPVQAWLEGEAMRIAPLG